ncbi:heme NO-binding domain-containing protein [Thermosipho ferrireducens]|uniref:Heme NO-binding domain-containing protein n=1 Tax=Thermosipho ferrireducens TaxID=2571116 RepID=A0ABX7S5V4_9BACT|nr:heme NO-binding domain-containing protein [Thermosipho ferrireducens]
MKSFIMNIWITTWKKLYGEQIVDSLITELGVDTEILQNPIKNVDDSMVVKFSSELAKRLGKTYEKIWEETGYQNLWSFKKFYPGYFKKKGLLSFMKDMDMVHKALTRRIKGANPPRIIYTYIDEKTAIIRYESSRDFRSYFLGLLRAASDFFDDPAKIEVLNSGKEGDKTFLEVRVLATKPFGKKIILRKFKALSFGLMKSFTSNFIVLLPIVVFLSSIIFSRFLNSVFSAMVTSIIVLIAIFFGTTDLKKGFKALKDLNKLYEEKDFSDIIIVKGERGFEEVFDKTLKAHENLKEFFTALQGDTEELLNFSNKTVSSINAVQEQIDTMKELSGQVADTAIQISNDAEKISEAVSSNVETISKTIEEQNSIVKNLNDAVENIILAAKSVEDSSDNISTVSDNFEAIAAQSSELKNQADEIKGIANTVMNIAEQTNLLALNAAIEAARSGEAGRGFAVVADEIRKLAEESKSSANKISEFLNSISFGIEELSNGVMSEYENLKTQSIKLSESAKQSKKSSKVISEITVQLNSLIESLNNEATKLENITTSIQNLLAISEESSATAEEISASIQKFLGELDVVFDNVSQTIGLLKLIQDNLKELKL